MRLNLGIPFKVIYKVAVELLPCFAQLKAREKATGFIVFSHFLNPYCYSSHESSIAKSLFSALISIAHDPVILPAISHRPVDRV